MIEYFQFELTQGKVARIDEDNWDSLSSFSWSAMKSRRGQYYAVRGVWENGKVIRKWLHREIMNCPAGMFVDHINGDSMDNRRENLRICTSKQNSQNQKRRINNTTGVKGVFFNKFGSYVVTIRDNGKAKYLGSFKTLDEATTVRREAELRCYGEFARPA